VEVVWRGVGGARLSGGWVRGACGKGGTAPDDGDHVPAQPVAQLHQAPIFPVRWGRWSDSLTLGKPLFECLPIGLRQVDPGSLLVFHFRVGVVRHHLPRPSQPFHTTFFRSSSAISLGARRFAKSCRKAGAVRTLEPVGSWSGFRASRCLSTSSSQRECICSPEASECPQGTTQSRKTRGW
jgi:hypothetical protein